MMETPSASTGRTAYALAAETLRVALLRHWGLVSHCRGCGATVRKSADPLFERHWRLLDALTEDTSRAAACGTCDACGSRRLHLYWFQAGGRMTGHDTLADLARRDAALDMLVAVRGSELPARGLTT